MAVPGSGRAEVDGAGRWRLPEGAVLARTVTLDLVGGDPASRRRLETQVLHREEGSWRPYTYIWDDAQADAMLADAAGATRKFSVRDPSEPGGVREQVHRFAARSECGLCHNPWSEIGTTVFGRQSASPLALSTAQLDRGEQLRRFEALGLLTRAPSPGASPRMADPRDESTPLQDRARAYLQANCAHCHLVGAGGSANLILGAETPLDKTRALDASPLQGTFGLDDARIIAPGEPERSVLFYRMAKTGPGRMPRVGSDRVDVAGTRLVADWIASLPGGRSEGRGAILDTLAAPSCPPAARREAIDRLLGSSSGALALARRIDAGRVPEPARREAAEVARATGRPEVADLFERFLPPSERAGRLGDAFDPAAVLTRVGDARRGRDLFRGSALSCRSCHKAEGDGIEIGPPLDGLGAKYARADLLGHIVQPSRTVEPKYEAVAIATRDGQVHVGLMVEESAREIVIRDATGRAVRIPVAEVEGRRREARSLMPEGLLRDLTPRQAADLVAYLSGLKAR